MYYGEYYFYLNNIIFKFLSKNNNPQNNYYFYLNNTVFYLKSYLFPYTYHFWYIMGIMG